MPVAAHPHRNMGHPAEPGRVGPEGRGDAFRHVGRTANILFMALTLVAVVAYWRVVLRHAPVDVSRYHLAIERHDDELRLIDLSSQGTYLPRRALLDTPSVH